MRTLRSMLVLVVLSLLALAACGGEEAADDADDVAEEDTGEDAGDETDSGDADDGDAEDSDDGDAEEGDDGELIGEGRTLTVLNWNNFGSDHPEAIEGFEERTGATVEHVYHSGSDEVRQILRTGGVGEIDVVQPNPTYLLQLYEEDLIDPIDEDLVPNLDKIAEEFMEHEAIRVDGELYGAPVVWGSTGLTYNTEVFDEEPTSWETLWDPENEGDVAFMDSAENAIMLAALYIGEDPQDPDLDAVREALIDLRPNVETFWGSGDDFTRAFTTGSVTVGNFWAGNAGTLMAQGEPVGYTIPEEGAVGWMDTWTIVKDAPNRDLAHEWINWMLSTEFQVAWAEDPEGGAPAMANVEASEQMSEEARNRVQAFPEQIENLAMQSPVSPERQQEYTDLWEEVKAGAQ